MRDGITKNYLLINDNLEGLFNVFCEGELQGKSLISYRLTDLCTSKQWKTISSAELEPLGEYPVYGAGGLIGRYREYNHAERTIGTVCRGAGCGNMVMFEPYSYITGNVMCFDNISSTVGQPLLYFLLKKRGLTDVVSGSAQPQITGAALKNIVLAVPTKEVVDLITRIGSSIYDQIEQNIRENRKLAQLRDYLLPRLLSGQITIKN